MPQTLPYKLAICKLQKHVLSIIWQPCHWLSLSHILNTSSRRTCSSFCTSLIRSEFPSLSSLSPVGEPLVGLCMRSNATSMACMARFISVMLTCWRSNYPYVRILMVMTPTCMPMALGYRLPPF